MKTIARFAIAISIAAVIVVCGPCELLVALFSAKP